MSVVLHYCHWMLWLYYNLNSSSTDYFLTHHTLNTTFGFCFLETSERLPFISAHLCFVIAILQHSASRFVYSWWLSGVMVTPTISYVIFSKSRGILNTEGFKIIIIIILIITQGVWPIELKCFIGVKLFFVYVNLVGSVTICQPLSRAASLRSKP